MHEELLGVTAPKKARQCALEGGYHTMGFLVSFVQEFSLQSIELHHWWGVLKLFKLVISK